MGNVSAQPSIFDAPSEHISRMSPGLNKVSPGVKKVSVRFNNNREAFMPNIEYLNLGLFYVL